MKRRRDGGDKEGRAYASAAMRVTAHPTRETILRTLEEKPRSTVELEKITGESRYNLYHHLAILERLNLIGHRVDEGQTKEFFLTQTHRRGLSSAGRGESRGARRPPGGGRAPGAPPPGQASQRFEDPSLQDALPSVPTMMRHGSGCNLM